MNITNCVRFLAVIFLLVASACGKGNISEPMDVIPSDVQAVAAYDLNGISQGAGASTLASGGKLTPRTAEAFKIFLPPNLEVPLAILTGLVPEGFDASCLICFSASNGYPLAVTRVMDKEAMSDALVKYRDEDSDFGDFELYTINRRALALSESLCIVAPDVATIRSIITEERKHSLSAEMPGIKEFLNDRANAINIALPAKTVEGPGMKDLWLCSALRFTSNAATLEIKALQPDGTPDSIGTRIAAPIDPDVLQLIPEHVAIVIASGKQPAESLIPIKKLTGKIFPPLNGIPVTGTSAYYGRPAGDLTEENLMNPALWNLASLIQLPEAELPSAMHTMAETTDGNAHKDAENGQMIFRDNDISVSYGYVDGYFTEAYNGPVTSGNVNSLSSVFSGARLAAMVDAPLGSQLQKGAALPCGASLSLKVTTWNIRLKLALYGNQQPPVTFIAQFPAIAGVFNYITGGTLM